MFNYGSNMTTNITSHSPSLFIFDHTLPSLAHQTGGAPFGVCFGHSWAPAPSKRDLRMPWIATNIHQIRSPWLLVAQVNTCHFHSSYCHTHHTKLEYTTFLLLKYYSNNIKSNNITNNKMWCNISEQQCEHARRVVSSSSCARRQKKNTLSLLC